MWYTQGMELNRGDVSIELDCPLQLLEGCVYGKCSAFHILIYNQ